jgi:hypothetical protein
LLLNDDPEIVKAGAWIASELGGKGKSLLDAVFPLLEHPDSRVRFSVIDCILLWADSSHGLQLASVLRLLSDSESRVRWKALEFLSRASKEQLSAALLYLEIFEPQSKNIQGLRALLRAEKPLDAMASLQDSDELIRKYGAVLARRLAHVSKEPLLFAASLDDVDVKDFAKTSLSLL